MMNIHSQKLLLSFSFSFLAHYIKHLWIPSLTWKSSENCTTELHENVFKDFLCACTLFPLFFALCFLRFLSADHYKHLSNLDSLPLITHSERLSEGCWMGMWTSAGKVSKSSGCCEAFVVFSFTDKSGNFKRQLSTVRASRVNSVKIFIPLFWRMKEISTLHGWMCGGGDEKKKKRRKRFLIMTVKWVWSLSAAKLLHRFQPEKKTVSTYTYSDI